MTVPSVYWVSLSMLHHLPTLPSEYLDDGMSKFPLTPEERVPYEGLPNSPRDMIAE